MGIVVQAHDKEIHAMWTSEIRRLLQVQFLLMKGERHCSLDICVALV